MLVFGQRFRSILPNSGACTVGKIKAGNRHATFSQVKMFTPRSIFCVSFVLWLSASIAGMTTLWNHEARPGIPAAAPTSWPRDSALSKQPSKAAMLVWIHPHCPCSWATIRELERLLVHVSDDTDCQIILTRPAECGSDFVESDLTRAIRKIRGVSVVVDDDQRESSLLSQLLPASGRASRGGRASNA